MGNTINKKQIEAAHRWMMSARDAVAECRSIIAPQQAGTPADDSAEIFNAQLTKAAHELCAKLIALEIIIAALEDSKSRYILREYYTRQQTWTAIAKSLDVSFEHLHRRLRTKALQSAYNALVTVGYIKPEDDAA